ncbi:Sugar kinase, partial [hydrothermal vent metagenome]
MTALICGSYAYDNIMVFHDHFKNHILPDKVHILNVSFLVPDMRREFGGCAGNIAYNLNLLAPGSALPMATVGSDFTPYANWMTQCGISDQHIKIIADSYTGQAFITTDLDDNQITAFHPGAMSFSHQNKVGEAKGISIGVVSPDGRDGMVQHAEQFVEAGIPFIFDPGQGLPMFGARALMRFIEQADYAIFNDYEMQLMQDRTGKAPHELTEKLEALIVTRGSEGSVIYTKEHRIEI